MSEDVSLWERIEPLLAKVERPSRYLDHEYRAARPRKAAYRAALLYPDTYELGQSNQAIAILYSIINGLDGCAAERVYLPWVDMIALMRTEGIPLFTLEGTAPVASFDLLGVTLPHELAATNILEALDLAGLPLHSAERDARHPLVLGGGPGAFNPEPLAPFFDAFVVGEGEEVIAEVVAAHRAQLEGGGARGGHDVRAARESHESREAQGARESREVQDLREARAAREALLLSLASLEGLYVPSLYAPSSSGLVPRHPAAPPVVTKRVVADFDACPSVCDPVVPFAEVAHDRLAVEVLRGCSRGCRFCQAGMTYRPVRERTADTIVAAVAQGLAATGFDEVSLTSLSTTDHSQIEQVLRRLNRLLEGTGVGVSIPSQRLDAFGIDMARLVAGEKKAGLTFAPEAGTQRLRDAINKNVTEDDLLDAVRRAMEAGWRRCKLYFMIGLPGETDDDVQGIATLANRAFAAAKDAVEPNRRGGVRMTVSVAVFVPKPHTPFQWGGQLARDEVARRIALLRSAGLSKGIDLRWHDPGTSRIEAALSRAGREAAALVEQAWRQGALFDAWSERFDEVPWEAAAAHTGLGLSALAERDYALDEALPWGHIHSGVSVGFLKEELARSREAATLGDCSFGGCSACGVCTELDVQVRLGGECRG
ncbi:MAG: radical SAM protein [Coriobacteriales bacterium]|nr:radical SAM protein [Coriobacteriales bacterium]